MENESELIKRSCRNGEMAMDMKNVYENKLKFFTMGWRVIL